ncbi:MAG: hypothetical protein J0I42_20320 [Bosea sp.]|uniref:hypothetical protein n=1 Tax=Bosea sp. (in: a-proteobacteria) TaxID=1871050 RepID=UPI001AD137C6|nr:hypothetical protein [Bosea sp. (in: a-proteobacteria)]MBN9454289.1 hypothetical protein [Bosea sp. (in: a-proteobacteria)]
MTIKASRPVACQRETGLGNGLCLAAVLPEHTTTALALKRILSRVAVSPSVALVIAGHAGLLKEARH